MVPPMLLDEVGDCVTCHRRCGQLTADATEPEAKGALGNCSPVRAPGE
jgi:hypothetical protein